MRPADKGALDSLYFRYPKFSARRPEPETEHVVHPVVIVGGGPVGLLAALLLARQGIASVVLERKNTFNDGSRAICIARQSFQILEQAGAVKPFLAKALGWQRGRSFYRGYEFYQFDMPHSANEKYLPMYNLQQQYIEQFLFDACFASPLVDIRWESALKSLVQQDDRATLSVASPAGDHTLCARYVLAADGARSTVRSSLGLRLKGDNHEGRYVIADVRMEHDYPTERRALFEPASNPGGTVLIHRQPDNIWRIDYQLRDGEDEAAAVLEENIRARVGAILAEIGHVKPWELEWWSIYSANTLCLDDYRHGRVIFIGDSAHIVPIFGVRGLNNGLTDAQNAAWKLAYVLKGLAPDTLLDSYSPERRGATLDVFANASKSARFMTPPSRGWQLARNAVLSLALKHSFARELANPRQMTPYTYDALALMPSGGPNEAFSAGPGCGAAARNVRRADGSFLLERAGPGFTGLFFGTAEAAVPFEQALLARDPQFRLLTLAPEGPEAAIYGARVGSFYLLRPDLHIAGRWLEVAPDEAAEALRIGLGGDQS